MQFHPFINQHKLKILVYLKQQVKNSFISLLIDVQNRQKEHRELLRKKKKIRSTTTTGPNGQRTNTHIPGTVSHVVWEAEQRHTPRVHDFNDGSVIYTRLHSHAPVWNIIRNA